MEKGNGYSNKYLIHAVENRKGEKTNDREKIIQEATEFYETLYGKKEMETDYEKAGTMDEDVPRSSSG